MEWQAACDWRAIAREWRSAPPRGALPEDVAYLCLREIEEARRMGRCDGAEADEAEAVILTRLAEARWNRPGGRGLARTWLERARRLDPGFLPAAALAARLAMDTLAAVPDIDGWPVIRETDNAVTRRRQIGALRDRLSASEAALRESRELVAVGLAAAESAGETELAARLKRLEEMAQEMATRLEQIGKRAEAYEASLEGLYFSSDRFEELQSSIREYASLAAAWRETARLESERADRHEDEQTGNATALERLDELIGLDEVKRRIRDLAMFLHYQRIRQEQGWTMRDRPELHLVLTGNPGTGKTTLARLIARLYYELGLLERDEVIEVDRSHLVGAYVGQTEQRTMEAVKRAIGGVLFIDEAYSLKRADSSPHDYGQAAIDTLVAAMTSGEYAGRFAVILAGYPEEMRAFLMANPGLRSRFPETGHFHLPDYADEELLAIAEQVARRNDFAFTPEARRAFLHRLEQERVDESFGNARTATNIVLDAIFAKGRRLREGNDLRLDDFTLLYPEDLTGEPEEDSRPARRSAEERLNRLIGLASLKEELAKIAAFVRVQRHRREQGLPAVPVELHAVFVGNPGTGKTTAARLYAELLKEIGYLKRGHVVAVSRADLVAGYVGQTALRTKQKIREALGGVLFIDEAYALAGGGELDFGGEAVQTLVDEMTRHGENLVVVLAGYPAEMERLMAMNPGLRSRFKKFIAFPDYTPVELAQIVRMVAEEAGYSLDDATLARVAERLDALARADMLHGNARFARNLVQEAIQAQALRLARLPAGEWTIERMSELTWEDVEPLLAPPAGGAEAHEGGVGG